MENCNTMNQHSLYNQKKEICYNSTKKKAFLGLFQDQKSLSVLLAVEVENAAHVYPWAGFSQTEVAGFPPAPYSASHRRGTQVWRSHTLLLMRKPDPAKSHKDLGGPFGNRQTSALKISQRFKSAHHWGIFLPASLI